MTKKKCAIDNIEFFQKGLEIFIRKCLSEATDKEKIIEGIEFQKYHKNLSIFCIYNKINFNSDIFICWFETCIISQSWSAVPSNSQLEDLFNKLIDTLKKSLDQCIFIIPLPFASLSKSIKISSDLFLTAPQRGKQYFLGKKNNHRSPYEIGKVISCISGLGKQDKRLSEYLAHFKKCYSPYITSYPLLVIKQEDIFYNVQYYAPFLSLYVKNCIKLIWKFYSCNKSKILGQPGNYEEIKHIIVGSKRSSFTSIPLHHPQNHFRFDLTEFSSPKLQEHLISLFNIWSFDTKLAQIYRRAIRFFCWDMDEGSRPYEYFSIRIQMMFIGIETLLLTFSYSGEKKRKIAKIMIQLYTANKYSSKEIEDAVISLYNSRNTYAHTGVDESFRYRPKLDDGQLVIDDDSLKIVDHVFNNILVTFPMKYNELLKAEDGENEWRKITQDFIKKTSLIQKLLNLLSFLCLCKKK